MMEGMSANQPNTGNVADFLCPPQVRDESKWHVSTLISAVLGDRERVGGVDDAGRNIMGLGRIWEETVMRRVVLKEAMDREMAPVFDFKAECDGIIGTLDGLLIGKEGLAVWENKVRFRERHPPQHYARWMYQVKAYCHMVGCDAAWLTVLHLSTRPPNADLVWWGLKFTPEELEENWRMLRNQRDYLEDKAKGGK